MKVAGRTALQRAPERCRSIRQQPRSLHAATLSYRLYTRQSPRYGPTARGYVTATATDPARPPAEVAVVGGGITGLTTAYYLGKFLPSTSRVTVYEGEKRVGGWIHTVQRQAPGGGEVVFENGPRMLRGLGGVGFRGDDYVFYDIASPPSWVLSMVGSFGAITNVEKRCTISASSSRTMRRGRRCSATTTSCTRCRRGSILGFSTNT